MMPDGFDKFTASALRVFSSAQQYAQSLSHSCIGTEHLLLGLLGEREGVAAQALSSMGVKLDELERLAEVMIFCDGREVVGTEGLSPRAKGVIAYAVDEARRLNHHYVGTEHLLLGLVREGEGTDAEILAGLGVSLDRVRAMVLYTLSLRQSPGHTEDLSTEKVKSLDEMALIRQAMRESGAVVVVTNGHFDVLHVGHLRFLEQARSLGDHLIVGLNGDASTRQLKGEKRPLIPQDERAELLAGLGCVDFVVIFEELTAERLVEALRPDIYVKGGDYSAGVPWPEADLVWRQGGQVLTVPFAEGHSTTDLIHRIVDRYR